MLTILHVTARFTFCECYNANLLCSQGIFLIPTGLPCLLTGSGNIASGQQSDHLLMAAAYDAWATAKHKVHFYACAAPGHAAMSWHQNPAQPLLSF